jgi:Uncharacterized conserved protein (COG2071)
MGGVEGGNMKTLTPAMHGIIDRRMLVNFRVQPDVIRKFLPPRFQAKLVKGWAMAGVCLIRLKDIRPNGLPLPCGITSENAAHRIAVEWNENGALREGVFIPRRDTSSALQALAGGRIFPGLHHLANFDTVEYGDDFQLKMHSRDGSAFVQMSARRAAKFSTSSIFASLHEDSDFFARGAMGYSATHNPDCCEGLELFTARWQVEPLDVQSVRSSFFDDTDRFPRGSIHFDCALLMRNIEHEWHVLPTIQCQE